MAIKTDDSGSSRFYYEETAPELRLPGVTSIIDLLGKPFLQRWAANMAADLALDSIDYLQRMVDRDRAGAKRYVAGAASRYTKQRSDIGTKAHILFEKMIRGQAIGRVHPDMVPYQRHFADFLEVALPQLVRAEDVAWSDTYGYAGSFDAWLRLRVVPMDDGTWMLDPWNTSGRAAWVNVIDDWKTSKSIWPSVALQMSAYANADYIISPDGQREPMPVFDGAVVLHITPDGWNLVPVYAPQLERAFNYFLHLRELFDWERTDKAQMLGKSLARSGAALTGTERRA
ncbi:hypothetical protein ACIGPN_05985 [Streptomyces afghaniensis]|uniref:hypothetical protein n=1 Tax=Streptomyces afghaniensis TaxID=66865 RepID=UPI0037CEA849